MKKLVFISLLPLLALGQTNLDFNDAYAVHLQGGISERDLLEDKAQNNDSGDMYWTQAVHGAMRYWQATGDLTVLNDILDDAITWKDGAVVSSTIPSTEYNDSYLSWVSDGSALSGQGSAPATQEFLYEGKYWTKILRVLHVMKDSPNLLAQTNASTGNTYLQDYTTLKNFIRDHVWAKWAARAGYYSAGVDKEVLMAYLSLGLDAIEPNSQYDQYINEFDYVGRVSGFAAPAGNFRAFLEEANGGYYWYRLWDESNYGGVPQNGATNIVDIGHCEDVTAYMQFSYETGRYWNATDIDKLVGAFKIFRPASMTNDECWNFIDGSSGVNDDRTEFAMGWADLGKYDGALQTELVTDVTLNDMYEFRYASCFVGSLVFNKAVADGTVTYPENYYSGTPTIVLADSDIKAFPTSVGHGRNATGGRGGNVYHVTNLNGSGAGSFREGVQSGARPRTIVFDVSGVMDDSGGDYISIGPGDGDLTIAGETSPNGFVIPQEVRINDSNVIMRHVSIMNHSAFRSSGRACLRLVAYNTDTVEDITIDHVSMMGADDEIVTVTATSNGNIVQDVTIQNSIIQDNLNIGYNSIQYYQTANISWWQNLMGYTTERHIRLSSARHSAEMINNYIYNYTGQSAAVLTYGTDIDLIGNHWDHAGNAASHPAIDYVPLTPSHETGQNAEAIMSNSLVYYSDNLQQGSAATYDADAQSRLQGSRVLPSDIIPYAASGVRDSVLANAGATIGTPQPENSHFSGRRSDVQNLDTGARLTSFTYPGSYPTIANGTAYPDADSDGLSDAYESANGGSVTQSDRPATAVISDGTIVDQSGVTNYATTGYTHLDIFMADMAGDWDGFARMNVENGQPLTKRARQQNYEVSARARRL